MNWRHFGTLLISAALWGTPITTPATADVLKRDDYVQFVTALTDQVTIPAYKRFAIETSVLGETLKAYCGVPSAKGFVAVTARFHDTMDAWARVQPILFGPIMDAPGPARFQFWPDKRGTGQRQLRRVLGAEDPSVLYAETLQSKSIALGDLQALEYVLFEDPDALTLPGAFRCHYASAIAELQRTRSALLYHEWTKPNGYRTQVIDAADGTEAFFDEREAASAYLSSLISAIEVIRLQKLDRPMGLTVDGARGTRAENWRSQRSMRNIALNVETLLVLFTTDGGMRDLLRKAQSGDLGEKATRLIMEIKSDISRFDEPLSALVGAENARPKLEALLTKLRELQSLTQDHIAANLGLVPGFNATDGD